MKPIPGYEELYSITSDGRLFAIRRSGSRGGEIGGYRNADGYLLAVLTLNYHRWTVGIHRLVALAWIGPPPSPSHEPNHKNGVRDDNRSDNLEWVTHAENCRPDRALALIVSRARGEANGSVKLSEEQVREVFRLRAVGLSQQRISDALGGVVQQPHISRILRGQSWAHL